LFETIGGADDEDEYVIKVDHLPNYFQDRKANTTAEKKFCRYLRGNEVTLDFMETVRRSCVCPCLAPGEEGRFLFAASKVNGKDRGFKRRWDDSITKPLQEEKPATALPSQTITNQAPQKSVKEELRESVELVKELYTIMAPARQQNPPPPSLSPADPMDTVRSTIGLFKDLRGDMKEMFADAAPAGTERHWSESLLNGAARLFDSLHIGAMLEKGGELLSSAYAQAQREAVMQAAANGNNADVAATPPSGFSPLKTALPAGTSAVSGESAAPSTPQAVPSAAATIDEMQTISAEEMVVLEVVVAEIRSYEEEGDTEGLEDHVAKAAAALRTLSAERVMQLLPMPNAFLLVYLTQVNPEWADLADMNDAGAFISALKKELMAGVKGSGGPADVVQFPPLVAVERGEGSAEQKEAANKTDDEAKGPSSPSSN